ncbi:MAG: chemotaxis response regulator protein-glutamate methylesterase [Lyngbya sp. HA4199-MV5]|jgi:two-component system chemotaxis response regulator CheB|nr:chemotaxis response regulator protein-glutamate methylesterase [Lyngbya sp. HA4199-MV5]
MTPATRVLIVDDSAYVRKVLKQMLAQSPSLEVVGTARNGNEALELIEQLQPDVVTLDLVMPDMDGTTFLHTQMQRHPVPIVIVSIANETGEEAVTALNAGAIDFVQKPTALATDKMFAISQELIAKVENAAQIPLNRSPLAWKQDLLPLTVTTRQKAIAGDTLQHRAQAGNFDLLVIGISTGGPQALNYLIPLLSEDFPIPVAIVLHMPVGYTQLFAQRLNERSALNVVEAQEGEVVRPGVVWIAPAGRHLSFIRKPDGTIVTHLDARPFDTLHRPAVDVLFQSAADVYGDRTLGIVMTGMGSDGKQGAAWIKAAGGTIVTEAENTCVVYGMPRSVDEAGLSDRSIPLDQIAPALLKLI